MGIGHSQIAGAVLFVVAVGIPPLLESRRPLPNLSARSACARHGSVAGRSRRTSAGSSNLALQIPTSAWMMPEFGRLFRRPLPWLGPPTDRGERLLKAT